MINADFIKDYKALLEKYNIKAILNEDGYFLIDVTGVPILFAPM